MWDLILSVPNHCLSFYFLNENCTIRLSSHRNSACFYELGTDLLTKIYF